jgi:uncharacterized protein
MPTLLKPALPIGWPLLPLPDETGQLRFRTLDQSVRDQIRIILLTRPGEQLMKPGFGAGLEDFTGLPNTVDTRREIHDRITDSLNAWEPRILLDRVEVSTREDAPSEVAVEIHYRLRRTGAAQRVALSVELKG